MAAITTEIGHPHQLRDHSHQVAAAGHSATLRLTAFCVARALSGREWKS
jgi:hypothetical protein